MYLLTQTPSRAGQFRASAHLLLFAFAQKDCTKDLRKSLIFRAQYIIIFFADVFYALIAQSAERIHGKDEVPGPIPGKGSIKKVTSTLRSHFFISPINKSNLGPPSINSALPTDPNGELSGSRRINEQYKEASNQGREHM